MKRSDKKVRWRCTTWKVVQIISQQGIKKSWYGG